MSSNSQVRPRTPAVRPRELRCVHCRGPVVPGNGRLGTSFRYPESRRLAHLACVASPAASVRAVDDLLVDMLAFDRARTAERKAAVRELLRQVATPTALGVAFARVLTGAGVAL